ncbi:hypothetical protein NC651_014813 [Populus alba x Populus x berolinensis]|nr:hypothetical protein NC651_014813 [Populus alba x Populus x berolinensis]
MVEYEEIVYSSWPSTSSLATVLLHCSSLKHHQLQGTWILFGHTVTEKTAMHFHFFPRHVHFVFHEKKRRVGLLVPAVEIAKRMVDHDDTLSITVFS